MDVEEIKKLASECLNCKNPLCKKGCPISTNIPRFIEKIKEGNLEDAYYILQQNNIMSEICSNVCFFEECCEGKCVKGIKGEPVKVSTLEKQVNLWANQNKIEYQHKLPVSNNIKIAIIGSGPAGISCRHRTCKKRLFSYNF